MKARLGTWSLAAAFTLVTAGVSAETLQGYAEWRRGETLIVDGQRVLAAPGLRLKGGVAGFDAIPLGFEVKAKGERLADGALLASEIEAKPNGTALFENELRDEFDTLERRFRRAGRVFDEDERGWIGESYGALHEDGPQVERVRRIAERLVPPSHDAAEFRVYVVDNEEWNAMAAPNGAIFVFSGLLEAMDDDEVAIVLGHELVHATHEHSRRGVKKGLLIELLSAGLFAAADEAIDSKAPRVAVQAAAVLGGLAWSSGFSRDQEDQADRVGLRYAWEAGYDVTKAPRLWERFREKYGDLPGVVNFFLGGHSTSKARARNLELEIARNYAHGTNDPVALEAAFAVRR